MTKLELFLLGSPRITLDGEPVTGFNTRKDCALLVYLAVTGAHHSRETLAALLWPDAGEVQARRNLRHALTHLRKVIGAHWLETEQGVAMSRDHPWRVDVDELRALVQKVTASPTTHSAQGVAQEVDALDQLLGLYRDEFLQGFHVHNAAQFEEWVTGPREELRLLALRGLSTLAERCLAGGVYEAGLRATRRLLELEPWSEQGHRRQMQLLAHAGRRTEALAQFERCRAVLATEFGVEPEQATIYLYEQIRAGLPPAAGGVASSGVRQAPGHLSPVLDPAHFSHNIPGQLTAFIGREEELSHIRALLLSPQHRLICIVGEGGIGKTRLALAVARSFVDEAQTGTQPFAFPDGVLFVSLAELDAPELMDDQLASAIAEASGLRFSGRDPVRRQLQEYLRDRALLLLLDNLEHLLPQAADFLVALLQTAPRLKLVVTSRRLLDLQAALAVPLKGLPTPLPQAAQTMTPGALLQASSSVALFAERARRANPAFQITPDNQAAIVAICALVEGMPLALELAAARTRQISCRQILAELQKSYTVLESNLRDLAPRHRSIHALLDYWRQILSPEMAALLTACSLFHGAFDGPAVAAIIGAPPDALLFLVEQSLLQVVSGEESRGETRFRLHELIRQYGADRLESQPERARHLRTAHARYYLDLLREQSRVFVHDLAALQRMQGELPNLRAAWEWAGVEGLWALLATSAFPLRQFYDLLSLFQEAENLFGRAVGQLHQRFDEQQADSAAEQERLIAHLQAQQAHFCMRMDQNQRAEALALAALEMGRRLKDDAVQGYIYLDLSTVYGVRTDWERAQHAAEQALVHSRAAGLPIQEVGSLTNLGCTFLYRGDIDRALEWLQQALELYERTTAGSAEIDRRTEGLLCLDLALAFQLAGDVMQARAYCQRSVEVYWHMQIPVVGVYALARLSELDALLGSYAQAAAHAQMALDICQFMGSRVAEGTGLGHLTYAYLRQGDWARADQTCQKLFRCIAPLGTTILRPFAHFLRGELLRQRQEWQAALAAYTTAREEYRGVGQMARAFSAQAKAAQMWLEMGDLPKALAQIEAVLPHLNQELKNSWLETTADYLICHRILAAAGDPRASAVLEQGHQYIHKLASVITDPALRHSFLSSVEANRALGELAGGALPRL